MPRKKAKEAEASVEETQPVEEETSEVEEKPEVPAEEVPMVEEAKEAPEEVPEVGETPVEEETPEVEEKPEVPAEEVPMVEEAKEAPEEVPEVGETPVEEETPEVPTEEIPEEAPRAEPKVPVRSLTAGAKFEYGGILYQKRNATRTIVSGLNLKETARTQQLTWKGFPPDTQVTPIKRR